MWCWNVWRCIMVIGITGWEMCTLIHSIDAGVVWITLFISKIVCYVSSRLSDMWVDVGVETVCVPISNSIVSPYRCGGSVYHGNRTVKWLMCLCDWYRCDCQLNIIQPLRERVLVDDGVHQTPGAGWVLPLLFVVTQDKQLVMCDIIEYLQAIVRCRCMPQYSVYINNKLFI